LRSARGAGIELSVLAELLVLLLLDWSVLDVADDGLLYVLLDDEVDGLLS
jgi:hypothetical protein